MSDLYILMILAGIGGAGASLNLIKKDNLKKISTVVFGAVAVFGFLLYAVTADPSNLEVDSQAQPEITNELIETPQDEVETVFDIPSLINLSIDEIIVEIGEPENNTEPEDVMTNATEEQIALINTWDKTFEKDGVSLMVTYDTQTRLVIDFFVSDVGLTEPVDDYQSWILKTNVDESEYNIEPVKWSQDQGKYTGVIISK